MSLIYPKVSLSPSHLSFFFSATACLIPCYSFFLSPSLRYKVTYSSNHNFLCYQRFFFDFRIISKSILHNHSNSIRKLNYDRCKWANTFLFFFFSSCFFFSWSWVVLLLFSFLFTLFFLFSFGVALFFFVFSFRCWTFLFFSFWGVPHLFFLVFGVGLFSSFFYCIFWGPCASSLSFNHLNKPLRNRSLIVLSRFSDCLCGTMVTQS